MARLGRGSASLVLLVALVLLAAAVDVATAATFPVGGGLGNWSIPSTTNNLDYQAWADSQTFRLGDEIVFNYVRGSHNVQLVANSAAYTSCDVNADDVVATYSTGRDVVELTGGPNLYFICGILGHCDANQKFQLSLTSGSLAPAGSTPPATPAPSNSHRSMPRFGVVLLGIAGVFCAIFAL